MFADLRHGQLFEGFLRGLFRRAAVPIIRFLGAQSSLDARRGWRSSLDAR